MIGLTLCSGIGAPEMAAPWIDWRFAAEIEPFPRAVLAERFGYKLPDDHNQGDPLLWSDMTEATPDLLRTRGLPLPDLIVAGTPCQAFSIAGLRGGTADARGNLTLKFVEICHAIVNARPNGKLAVLWENVPGVLSDKGNAFGCFLGGLIGADDALPSPDGGSWPSSGMVSGPRSRAAWRVLDAQHFGVPQRRKRVFVVVDFGNSVDPAAVLFERKSLQGNTAPRRETGKEIAASLTASTGGCSGKDNPVGRVIAARNTAISEYKLDDTASTLAARDYKSARDLIAFDCKGTAVQFSQDEINPPLRSMSGADGQGNAGGHAAVAFDMRGRDGGAMPEGPHDTANIRAAAGGSSRSYVLAFDPNQITSKANGSQPKPEIHHTLPATSTPPRIWRQLGRFGGSPQQSATDCKASPMIIAASHIAANQRRTGRNTKPLVTLWPFHASNGSSIALKRPTTNKKNNQPNHKSKESIMTNPTHNSSDILKHFEFAHLPEDLQQISQPLCAIAAAFDKSLPPSAEKSTALRKMLEAKDCLVRAAIEARGGRELQKSIKRN